MAARKLTAADLEEYRKLLLHLRREVSGDINQLEQDAFSGDGEKVSTDNPADQGSDRFAQEFSLELLQRDGETLEQIEEALGRIEKGTFGICGKCGERIKKARLQALPFARYCIECQRQAELEG
ncbi:MAG: TraR/DksA C4-type zinc finger protein [Planctomycetota bacterium]